MIKTGVEKMGYKFGIKIKSQKENIKTILIKIEILKL